MQKTIRVLIESFLRGRIGYEGQQAFWVLVGLLLSAALAFAVYRNTGPALGIGTLGLGLLLILRGRLALPLLIGSILVVAAILFAPSRQAAF